jgi:hypothetical protein
MKIIPDSGAQNIYPVDTFGPDELVVCSCNNHSNVPPYFSTLK